MDEAGRRGDLPNDKKCGRIQIRPYRLQTWAEMTMIERNRGTSTEQTGRPLAQAAQVNLEAARALGAAARELAGAVRGSQAAPLGISSRWKDATASAVASGVLLALRRAESAAGGLIAPTSRSQQTGLRGTGYGRLGASITGQGEKAQAYGAIGGVIGYALGGPIGGIVGGMLGGLFGGKKKQSKPALERSWLNTPEEFEIEAYLNNLRRAYALSRARNLPRVRVDRVEININGQGAQAGLEAGRAFATFLGQQVALNSAVALAPGYG